MNGAGYARGPNIAYEPTTDANLFLLVDEPHSQVLGPASGSALRLPNDGDAVFATSEFSFSEIFPPERRSTSSDIVMIDNAASNPAQCIRCWHFKKKVYSTHC
jgi:hypothetical protein